MSYSQVSGWSPVFSFRRGESVKYGGQGQECEVGGENGERRGSVWYIDRLQKV